MDGMMRCLADLAAEIALRQRLIVQQVPGRALTTDVARLRYEDETALDPLFEIKVAYGLAVIEQGAGRGNHSHDRFQKRRLPGPVWPDNRDDLTRLHFHRSVADGGDLSV